MNRRFFLTPLLLVACLVVPLVYAQAPFKGCPAEGTAKSAKNQAKNRLKNRDRVPSNIDTDITLRDLMLKANDKKFDEDTAVRVTGFVVDVTPGGKTETCNCGGTAGQDMHIDIVQRRGHAGNKKQHFVVEITPRWQADLGDFATVRSKIKGKCVQFTGYLFYDSIHADEAENTRPGRKGNWRKTAWEVHPVTSYRIVGHEDCPI